MLRRAASVRYASIDIFFFFSPAEAAITRCLRGCRCFRCLRFSRRRYVQRAQHYAELPLLYAPCYAAAIRDMLAAT